MQCHEATEGMTPLLLSVSRFLEQQMTTLGQHAILTLDFDWFLKD